MVSIGHVQKKYEHTLIAEKVLDRPLRFFGVGDGKNEVVHHINGIKTDNRNSNLLVCTHSYHTQLHIRLEASEHWNNNGFKKRNSAPKGQKRPKGKSCFKGVEPSKEKWKAAASINKKKIGLGTFETATEAARAYDRYVTEKRGPYWITNQSLGLL